MRWLLIVLAVIAIEAQTVETQPGSIEGRVTNSVTGDLIPGASIRLMPLRYAGENSQQLQVNSQSDGAFHFDSVPPGNYIVTAEKDGFVSNQSGSRPVFVALQAGQFVAGLAVQLTPQGSVAGRVVDDNGKPIPGAQVRAFSKSKRSPTATADASGVFNLGKLAPGDYYVVADPPEKTKGDFVRTIYPHSLNFDDAATIQVAAGQATSDVTIRLREAATYQIKGKVADPSESGPSQKFRVTILPRVSVEATALARSVAVNPDRTFEINGLVPGNYTLRLTGRTNRLLARQDVEIGSSSLGDVLLQVTPPLTLTGHVVAESQTPVNLTRVQVIAVPGEDLRRATQAFVTVSADGTFRLLNLDPGLYRIRVTTNLPGIYVKSVSFNQQDIANKEIDLSQTGAGQLEIVLRSGTGEIDGTVDPADSPAAVIFVPETLGPDGWTGVRFGYTRQGAAFLMADLPPGKYTVFAADRFALGLWQSAEFLRDIANLGTPVQLDENGRQQIQLQKVPVEQIQQIAARLSLPM